jgi:four helix bundle protein
VSDGEGNWDPPPARISRPHENLRCWKEAVELVVNLYRETRAFPTAERYGLTSQMRRATVSVPANIAEGVARRGQAERRQFLLIARGSLSELDTLIIISMKLEFLSKTQAETLLAQTGKVGAMLNGLIKREF